MLGAVTSGVRAGISIKLGSKLEKAAIYRMKGMYVSGKPVYVQFNPSEYSISRSLSLSRSKAFGRDQAAKMLQAVEGGFATMQVSLYFDTNDNRKDAPGLQAMLLPGAMQGAGSALGAAKSLLTGGGKSPDEVCAELAAMIKYDDEEHAPRMLRFVWGELSFTGLIANSTLHYTMFGSDGTPVRAKMDLTLIGEETELLQARMSRPFSSPNRTKERALVEGDSLWMLAEREYENPSMWREIARANGILNPRRLSGGTVLKVPSVK